jgi:hypothetical protein
VPAFSAPAHLAEPFAPLARDPDLNLRPRRIKASPNRTVFEARQDAADRACDRRPRRLPRGGQVPRGSFPLLVENELRHADDTLAASYEQAVTTAIDLIAFLPEGGDPVRAQRRERLDPQGRDRGLGAAGHPTGSRAAALNPLLAGGLAGDLAGRYRAPRRRLRESCPRGFRVAHLTAVTNDRSAVPELSSRRT